MGQNGMGSPAFGGVREINIYTVSQVKVKTCVSKTAFSFGRGDAENQKGKETMVQKRSLWETWHCLLYTLLSQAVLMYKVTFRLYCSPNSPFFLMKL